MSEHLTARAPAKVNLNLHVLGRRSDGYHILDSMVAFSDFGDELHLIPGASLSLEVEGPTAAASGAVDDNLVLRIVRALQARREGIKVGAFKLIKNLPVAAGIGGGSSDAAAAMRLIAEINDMSIDDSIVIESAKATGADVLVCLDPRLSRMKGTGEIVERMAGQYSAHAVLVNPRVAVATPDVFRALGLEKGQVKDASHSAPIPMDTLNTYLQNARNDLQESALSVAPVIGDVLAALRDIPTCKLARMSGSGATVFGLFDSSHEAESVNQILQQYHSDWWSQAVVLS